MIAAASPWLVIVIGFFLIRRITEAKSARASEIEISVMKKLYKKVKILYKFTYGVIGPIPLLQV